MQAHTEDILQKLFYFSIALLSAVVLLWFGSRLLFTPAEDISGAFLMLLGVGLVLGSIFMVGTGIDSWEILVLLVVIGFYFCARAAGLIEMAWLARGFGVASWVAAGLLLYIAWPAKRKKPREANETSFKIRDANF